MERLKEWPCPAYIPTLPTRYCPKVCPEHCTGKWYLKKKINGKGYWVWDYYYSLSENSPWTDEDGIKDYLVFKPNGEFSTYWFPARDSVYLYHSCTGTAVTFEENYSKKTKTDALLAHSLSRKIFRITMLTPDTFKFRIIADGYRYGDDSNHVYVYDHVLYE